MGCALGFFFGGGGLCKKDILKRLGPPSPLKWLGSCVWMDFDKRIKVSVLDVFKRSERYSTYDSMYNVKSLITDVVG